MGKPMNMRIHGSDPVQKWINLVKKWNTFENYANTQYGVHKITMIIVEVNELMKQYPELLNAVIHHIELETPQLEALRYGGVEFEFKIPDESPKPIKNLGGYNILQIYEQEKENKN